MVPLRFITETFGADVAFDAATSTITIRKAAGTETSKDDRTLLEQDAGKTHIGDSHYGWSMAYSPELSVQESGFSTSVVRFTHLKDEFNLTIFVWEDQPELSSRGLLNKAVEFAGSGTILSQNYVQNGQYAKVVIKENDGRVAENRVYARGDKQYAIYLITSNENFNDKQKWASYVDLLNSFTTEFEVGNDAYKDISNVKDGYRVVEQSEYGVTFEIPANWYSGGLSFSGLIQYSDADNERVFQTMVSSREDGDTPEAWAARITAHYEDQYVPEYLKLGELQQVEIGGIRGVARTNSYGSGTKQRQEIAGFQISKSSVMMFGVSATKFDLRYELLGIPIQDTMYVFEKNGQSFLITYKLPAANATESVKQRIQDTIDSITFQ